ncbi:hypothetical protein C3408_01265 [Candidatus Pantoea alvi]|nr:hypothetical protein C3408_01265 [Pantoea alvi]
MEQFVQSIIPGLVKQEQEQNYITDLSAVTIFRRMINNIALMAGEVTVYMSARILECSKANASSPYAHNVEQRRRA